MGLTVAPFGQLLEKIRQHQWMLVAALLWFLLFRAIYPPMWDESAYAAPLYGWLTSVVPKWLFHGMLAIGGALVFALAFRITPSPWWGLAIAPFVAVTTVESSAALPPFLILVALAWGRGAWAGLLPLARTEWLVLAILGKRWALSIAAAAIVLFMLTSRLTSPNGPAVFYISLGQLPGNAWGIEYGDSTAHRLAEQFGYPSPWLVPSLFLQASIDSVRLRPAEYVKKCGYNIYRIFHDGVWLGDGFVKPWSALLQVAYGGFMWVAGAWWFVRRRRRPLTAQERDVIVLVAIVIVMQSLGQQLVRHTNILYLPILGIAAGVFGRAATEPPHTTAST
jgi:hypothetical protein